jgi:hypothetical protein
MTSVKFIDRSEALVATGINAGVLIVPWGVARRAALAPDHGQTASFSKVMEVDI